MIVLPVVMISLWKWGKKRGEIRHARSLDSPASAATTVAFIVFFFFFYQALLHMPPPIAHSCLHVCETHSVCTHTVTLSHLCNHNSVTKKSSEPPSLRNQQLWDNSVTNKVKGRTLWWLKLKRYFIFFIFLCVGFEMCDSMEWAGSPAARLRLEAGPPLANVMENRRNFMAVFSLSPLFSFVPLWRMTLDILFTYLTMDERNDGWGSKAPWVLWGILISKKNE